MSKNGSRNSPPPSPPRGPQRAEHTRRQFVPTTPSSLREAHTLSQSPEERDAEAQKDTQPTNPGAPRDRHEDEAGSTRAGEATEATPLLGSSERNVPAGTSSPYEHGSFSPGTQSRAPSIWSGLDGHLSAGADATNGARQRGDSILSGIVTSWTSSNGTAKYARRSSTAASLVERHGWKRAASLYLTYYVPFFRWIHQYRWHHLRGDFTAALSMASFYLPMSLSYAANLAHVPPISGLYAFVFNPLIYAILGSSQQMIIGPEAPGCLLVGSVVKASVDSGKGGDYDDEMHGQIVGVVTGMAGAAILLAGLTRLGFLDSVLSRPFLRGFISAIGFVILVDQLIPELGLEKAAAEAGVNHGSSVDKLQFLVRNVRTSHSLTCAVAFASFATIMTCREIKKRFQPRYPGIAFVPDRFVVVALSIVLTHHFRWDKRGLQILGAVKSSSGAAFPFHWPFQLSHTRHIREAMGTSFLVALLGFFESSVAAKSLAGNDPKDGIQGVPLSANRELVALGAANLVGSCFRSVPAFGGYGRSKLNASTGGKTPMSNVFLSLFTIICILYVLPAFYFLPKAVLCAMISVVGISLLEEAPHDVAFFVQIKGFTELGLMGIIFAATIFYSLTLGIAIGIGLSLLSVIRHSTRPRIQIMGRRPGTDKFENAEMNPSRVEFIEGCLIVKIPEPLTFANTGDLKNRLRRLEHYGTTGAHPALPRSRDPAHNRNVIFDIHGVTGLDGSGAQVLKEIVAGYRQRGTRVYFSRCPGEETAIWRRIERSGILKICGGRSHFVASVTEALALTELVEEGEGGGEYHEE